MVTCCAVVLCDVLDVCHVVYTDKNRSSPALGRLGPLEHAPRRVGGRQLEQPDPVVADLLQRHRRLGPIDAAVKWHEVVVGDPPVVVQVRGDQVSRHLFDRVDQIPHQERVAAIEADADVGGLELVFDHRHQRRRARDRVGDDFERQRHPGSCRRPMDRLQASQHRVATIVPAVGLLGQRDPEVQHQEGGLQLFGCAQRNDASRPRRACARRRRLWPASRPGPTRRRAGSP